MDVISLFKHDIKNIIASSGTALTDEQVTLLSRFTKNVTIIFDADDAGQNAANRSVELFLKNDFNIKILTLPDKEDPDSYVNKFGKEKFLETASKSTNFLEFQLSRFKKTGKLDNPETQIDAIREVVRSISFINDDLKQSVMIKDLAKKFNLREIVLEKELEKLASNEKQKTQRRENYQTPQETPPPEYEEAPRPAISKETLVTEVELLRLLLEGDEKITGHIFDHFQPDEFKEPRFVKIAQVIYDSYMKDILDPSKIVNSVTEPELQNVLFKLTFKENIISKRRWEDVLDERNVSDSRYWYAVDIIKQLELKKIDARIDDVAKRLESATDEKEIGELLKLSSDLNEERKNVLSNEHHN